MDRPARYHDSCTEASKNTRQHTGRGKVRLANMRWTKLTNNVRKGTGKNMIYDIPLTENRIHEIMAEFSQEQRLFIENTFKQSKKSKWMEVLAERKGVVLDETMTLDEAFEAIDDWLLQDILDGGFGNRPFRCECGRTLRYQYIIHHKKENRTYKLGEKCFEHYTNLSVDILRDIRNGFYHIDLERDELLVNYKFGINHDISPYLELNIPADIRKQVDLALPLIEKQMDRLRSLLRENEEKRKQEEKEKRFADIWGKLTDEQKKWIEANYTASQAAEIVSKIDDGNWPYYTVEELKKKGISDTIIRHVELGLPLFGYQFTAVNLAKTEFKKQTRQPWNNHRIDYIHEFFSGKSSNRANSNKNEQFKDRELMIKWYNQLKKCKVSKHLGFFSWCNKAIKTCEEDFRKFKYQGFLSGEEARKLEIRITKMCEVLLSD